MEEPTRRTFLRVSGAVLGGIATGTTVTAAESVDRWIIDTKDARGLNRLEVIHDLDQVDLALVRGTEDDVKGVTNQYARDLFYQLEPPADGELYEVHSTVESDDGGEEEKPGKGHGRDKGSTDDGSTSADGAADEPLYPLQWDKQVLDIPSVHELTRGEGTRVAIIDTGVAAGHPDLQHAVNTDLSRDFTGDGYGAGGPFGGYHGTHVGGIVAANDANGEGVTGTAPATDLVDCRVFSPGQLASFADILAAMVYSAEIDADVANLSLGAYPIPRQGLGQFYGKSLNRVMTWVNKEGTALAIAAGNDSADLQHDGSVISLPNEGARALSISATGPIGFLWDADGDGEVTDLESPPESPAFYTNYGTNAIDLGAPGGDADPEAAEADEEPWYHDLVLNTIAVPAYDDDGTYLGATYGYGWVAGTSMAAPQVAGAVACYRSLHPDTTTGDVEAALEGAAEVPDGYDKAFYGGGFLNILHAL
jgi:subtilisin family serine protease